MPLSTASGERSHAEADNSFARRNIASGIADVTHLARQVAAFRQFKRAVNRLAMCGSGLCSSRTSGPKSVGRVVIFQATPTA